MEVDFKEPSLELHFMAAEAATEQSREHLREYVVSRGNKTAYRMLAGRGLFEERADDLERMETLRVHTIEGLQREKENDPENECHIHDINKRICEYYAQSMDMGRLESALSELLSAEPSLSLRMDAYLCRIRISLMLDDRHAVVENMARAEEVFQTTCDWDRKNRFKIYKGLYCLIRAEFREAAVLFSEGLASFDASELLSFNRLILYYVFCGLLGFSRTELKERLLDNSEVRKCSEYLCLPEKCFTCDYDNYLASVLDFIDLCAGDIFIDTFKNHFCKEMKIRGYKQLLLSYQSLLLDKMAEIFKIPADDLESDLRNFISEKRIQCSIDRVDRVVKMLETGEVDHIIRAMALGDRVLNSIKKRMH